jgi:hypothetical protein
LLILGEVIETPALNIERPDAFAAKHERNRQLRTHIIDSVDVARILRHVAYANRKPGARGRARNPLSDRDFEIFR